MIRVTTGETTVIGLMDIYNMGTHPDPKRGNYGGRIYRRGTDPKSGKIMRVGKIEDLPRLSYTIWRMVLRMLKEMFPEERS